MVLYLSFACFAVLVDDGTAKDAKGAKILGRIIAFGGGAGFEEGVAELFQIVRRSALGFAA
ncbi:MAG: hypothetical protein O8C62_02295 [Candidatus Methanoperedens sp.]|nr:hypothetical protein [Candidatus Methanoperedens sp.]